MCIVVNRENVMKYSTFLWILQVRIVSLIHIFLTSIFANNVKNIFKIQRERPFMGGISPAIKSELYNIDAYSLGRVEFPRTTY